MKSNRSTRRQASPIRPVLDAMVLAACDLELIVGPILRADDFQEDPALAQAAVNVGARVLNYQHILGITKR